jgi:hypothetical protein
MMPRLAAAAFGLSGIVASASVFAEEAGDAPAEHEHEVGLLPAPHGPIPYFRVLGTGLVGTGLRFNNPYRLATPLGDTPESLSRTAGYVDLGATLLVGAPTFFQHGPSLRLSLAFEGIGQEVLAPSYVVCRQWRAFQPCARLGIPVILRPDSNVGFEVGAGLAYYVRAGIGVQAEGVFDLFYGAATRDVAYPTYPILSGQLGLVVSYEVLP